MSRRCFVALGANLGNPVETVSAALDNLSALPQTQLVAASSLYRTAPVGLRHQPDFINAVAELATGLSATDLLQALFSIEEQFGRKRGEKNAPRTLDLDLLLYEGLTSAASDLELPHPRMHERAFVLAPLIEIAPNLAIPGRGSLSELLAACADQPIQRLLSGKVPQS